MIVPIQTERLSLVTMSPVFLAHTAAGRRSDAASSLGVAPPEEWFENDRFAAMRLGQFKAGVTSEVWLPRAIVLRSHRLMVGFIGFHTPPGPVYLEPLSPGGIELGFTVFPDFRRMGYACEASYGLMRWANANQGIRSFVVSVSPSNAASLAMIAKLGFRRIGSHVDEEDGPEDIFELRIT